VGGRQAKQDWEEETLLRASTQIASPPVPLTSRDWRYTFICVLMTRGGVCDCKPVSRTMSKGSAIELVAADGAEHAIKILTCR
jgi:hypothetical protein